MLKKNTVLAFKELTGEPYYCNYVYMMPSEGWTVSRVSEMTYLKQVLLSAGCPDA